MSKSTLSLGFSNGSDGIYQNNQTKMDKIILEVSVDRLNEKWVFVAEQILNVLHNTCEKIKRWFFLKDKIISPDFTFEIVNLNWIIRFFFVVWIEYKDLLENQIYAHFPNVEIREVWDYFDTQKNYYYASIGFQNDYIYPIKIYKDFSEKTEKDNIDPFSSITSSLIKWASNKIKFIQVNFWAIPDESWKSQKTVSILASNYPKFLKKFLLSKEYWYIQTIFKPIYWIFRWFSLIFNINKKDTQLTLSEDKLKLIGKKFEGFWYASSINFWLEETSEITAKANIKEIVSSLNTFTISGQNWFKINSIESSITNTNIFERKNTRNMILSNAELAWLVHLPTIYVQTPWINWVTSKTLEPPNNLPLISDKTVTPIWTTNFRWNNISFGISQDDRRRHMFAIGKTWMWKSVFLENLIYDDIIKWNWVALIDPHWDLAETIISNIPKSRTNDVIYFEPADFGYPIALNMFENVSKELRSNVASWLVSVFKRIFGNSWWPRLEYILRNSIITLLEIPDSTIMSIPLMLTNKSFRRKIISKITDPTMISYWNNEFETMDAKQMTEAINPILNKVGQFLSSPTLRNILCQPKNSFSFRWIMDNKKIFIANLSKWKIWEDSMELLWSLMITKFQIEAMRRADMEESKRKDFYLYVDEFQNFANDSFATILSEARKYKLNLTIANQYISQMTDTIRWAVFGNIGSMVSFQVGPEDAPKMVEAFNKEIVNENDLQNIAKYNIYTKLLIDGMPSRVFSAKTFPPIKTRSDWSEQSMENIKKVTREKYAKPVDFVEKKIFELSSKILEEEKKFKKEEAEYKEKIKEEKARKKSEEQIKRNSEGGGK